MSGGTLSIQDESKEGIRRQLVQVLLRDAVRRHGIPAHWIEAQMMVVSSTSKGPGMIVRLVLKHWDARFLAYAEAFQNALKTDITRFEPSASHWLHGITWQLEFAGTCPYKTMPPKALWAIPVAPPASLGPIAQPATGKLTEKLTEKLTGKLTVQSAQDEVRQDVERLFVIRDQELSRQTPAAQSTPPELHPSFAPTEPSALR